MSRSKPFRERSPAEQRGLAALTMVSVAIVLGAQRDIQRRPADQIRGPKALWRVVCLNAVGVAGYLKWGRRTADAPESA